MIHISNLQDCNLLLHDPELFREVTSYLLYCQHEIQEYADEDDPDFHFTILQKYDFQMLEDMPKILETPEETVQINIKADGHIITMYRIVYPTEVLFIPAEISNQFSF